MCIFINENKILRITKQQQQQLNQSVLFGSWTPRFFESHYSIIQCQVVFQVCNIFFSYYFLSFFFFFSQSNLTTVCMRVTQCLVRGPNDLWDWHQVPGDPVIYSMKQETMKEPMTWSTPSPFTLIIKGTETSSKFKNQWVWFF